MRSTYYLYAFAHDQTLCLVYEDFYLAIGFIFYELINYRNVVLVTHHTNIKIIKTASYIVVHLRQQSLDL